MKNFCKASMSWYNDVGRDTQGARTQRMRCFVPGPTCIPFLRTQRKIGKNTPSNACDRCF